MPSLFPLSLLHPEGELQVGWPAFVLAMAGVFVIGWVFNVLAGRKVKRAEAAHDQATSALYRYLL
jgi:hypothetical protein